jgi:hypothetical protein
MAIVLYLFKEHYNDTAPLWFKDAIATGELNYTYNQAIYEMMMYANCKANERLL